MLDGGDPLLIDLAEQPGDSPGQVHAVLTALHIFLRDVALCDEEIVCQAVLLIVVPVFDPGVCKDYLTEMHKWYEEGLLYTPEGRMDGSWMNIFTMPMRTF